jgi:methionyl-tRNA formyltransferase
MVKLKRLIMYNKYINFAFFGSTNYSKELLLFLIKQNIIPKVIFSIPQEFNISYSAKKVKNTNYANLKEIADKNEIKFYEIDSIEGKKTKDYKSLISDLNLDLLLVLGWYYMVPKSIRELAKYGAWGIHASLLPKYAGGAPLNWAIINGEKETGVTLFRMEDGVDDGDIIAQKSFSIELDDTIKEVYNKATAESKNILLQSLENIKSIKFEKQNKSKIKIYPQRTPDDGEINLTHNSIELYDFIRAQSDPYPGAFIKTIDGKKLIIEKARVE